MRSVPLVIKVCFWLLFLMLATSGDTYAQSRESAKDSLLHLINATEKLELKAYYLSELSELYKNNDQNKFMRYAQQALKKTEEEGFNNDSLKMEIVNRQGIAYQKVGEIENAKKYYEMSIEMAKELDYPMRLSRYYNNICGLYGEIHQYNKALDYCIQSLTIKEEAKDSLGISISSGNIGMIYQHLEHTDKSRTYYQKSFDISQSIGDEIGVAYGYYYLANIMDTKKEAKKKLAYYDKAIELFRQQGNNYLLTDNYIKKARTYIELGQQDEAIPYSLKAYDMSVEHGYTDEKVDVCLQLAKIYKEKKNWAKVITYTNRGLEYMESKANKNKLAKFYKQLADAHEATGNITKAYQALKRHQVEKDSAVQKANIESFAQMEAKYKSTLREEEQKNKFLLEKNSLNEKIINQQYAIVVIGGILFLLLSFLAYTLYQKQKEKSRRNEELESKVKERTHHLVITNKKLDAQRVSLSKQADIINEQNLELARLVKRLEESNEDLKNFAYVAAHDLNAPLRTISQFAAILRKKYLGDVPEKDADLFDFIINACGDLKGIINGLLQFSSITKNVGESYPISLLVIMVGVKNYLAQTLEEKNAELLISEDLPKVEGHENLLQQLFLNLCNNAIKFAKPDVPPVVQVYHSTENMEEGWVQITVEDNGIGIPEKARKRIFGMFNRLHAQVQYKGAGIGLTTCKKIVAKYNGKIWVESEEGKGSSFHFTLPLAQGA